METKLCSNCGELLPINNFRKHSKFAYRKDCKSCEAKKSSLYRSLNKDRIAHAHIDNKSIHKKATKFCSSCKNEHPLTNFGSHKTRSDGLTDICKKCRNLKVRVQRWGISIEQLKIMEFSQNNSCAICNKSKSNFKSELAIDHCHKTGKIRGLLCVRCNNGLGNFLDEIELLINAINYLLQNRSLNE